MSKKLNFFRGLMNSPTIAIGVIVLLLFSVVANVYLLTVTSKIVNNEITIEQIIDTNTSVQMKEVNVGHFNYTYKAFQTFNHETDSATVDKFLEVAEAFKMDTTEDLFRWSVGQILLESGAKQYYPEGHPKHGRLVESYAGAIGFCQIMPATALGYFKKRTDSRMFDKMIKLGATSFDFAYNPSLNETTKRNETSEWLSNKTNNIILWGVIMSSTLERKGNILKALVAYNAGTGGMNRFIANGGSLDRHAYIRGIRSKLRLVDSQ